MKKQSDVSGVRGMGFIAIALGLVYCMIAGQVEKGMMELIVGLVVIASFGLGIWQVGATLRNKWRK